MEKKIRDLGRAHDRWDVDLLWKLDVLDDKEVAELEDLVEELRARGDLR